LSLLSDFQTAQVSLPLQGIFLRKVAVGGATAGTQEKKYSPARARKPGGSEKQTAAKQKPRTTRQTDEIRTKTQKSPRVYPDARTKATPSRDLWARPELVSYTWRSRAKNLFSV